MDEGRYPDTCAWRKVWVRGFSALLFLSLVVTTCVAQCREENFDAITNVDEGTRSPLS